MGNPTNCKGTIMTLKKIYLSVYRLIGLMALLLLAGALLFYTATFSFFMFNKSWVAPTVLSPSDPKALQARAEMIRQQQFYEEATIVMETRRHELVVLRQRRDSLAQLVSSINSAIGSEIVTANRSVGEIAYLQKEKGANIKQLDVALSHIEELIKTNDSELAAKLITKSQHSERAIAHSQMQAAVTANRIEAKALADQRDLLQRGASTLQGKGSSVQALDAVTKKLELQNELAMTDVQIVTKTSEIMAAGRELSRLDAANTIIDKTPYSKVIEGNKTLTLGFMPYDNRHFDEPNQDVFSCFAIFIGCKKVGKVAAKYADEQIVEFPIFNTRFTRTVKGVFVEFDLTDDAAHEQILFIGGKPLFL